MPLIKSKSPEAFSKNIKAEMNAGNSQPKSLAIAYSMKQRAKKMAKGGTPCAACGMAAGGACMAHGGDVERNTAQGPENSSVHTMTDRSPIEPSDSTDRTKLQTRGGEEAETTAQEMHDRGVDEAEAKAAPSRHAQAPEKTMTRQERVTRLKAQLMAHGGSVSPNESEDKNDKRQELDTEGARQVNDESRAWPRMAKGGSVSPTSPDNSLGEQDRDSEGEKDAPALEDKARMSGVELARAYLDEEASKKYAEGGTVDPVNHDRFDAVFPTLDFDPEDDTHEVGPRSSDLDHSHTNGNQGRPAQHVDNKLVTHYADGGEASNTSTLAKARSLSQDSKDDKSLAEVHESNEEMKSRLEHGTIADPQDKMGGYSEGGYVAADDSHQDSIVDQIMKERSGPDHTEGEEEPRSSHAAMVPSFDSNYPHTPDPKHGDIPAEDDESVVGQILKARRDKRRGV